MTNWEFYEDEIISYEDSMGLANRVKKLMNEIREDED